MEKIAEELLDNVVGGAKRVINNTNAGYANILKSPSLHADVTCKLVNGTPVETTGKKHKNDGYTWYEIALSDGTPVGWITGNLLGY